MDWTDDYLTHICQSMANTHLNSLGYTEVSERLFQRIGIELTKT
jgi:hypothetical protein